MDDYKILIYIALSILYFIFKGKGKKKKPATRENTQPQPTQHQSDQKRKPKTFEEILAELSGHNQEDEETEQWEHEETYSEHRTLSEQVEERPLMQGIPKHDYENADETLKELYRKGERLKTIDELIDIDEITAQRTVETEIEDTRTENTFAKEIREGLSTPENAKKAFVYAEIFNRRY